jgi:uncharacterized protein YndB with AHSA1/START domain
MTTTVPAVRREILVDAQPDGAFRVFTEQIGAWWPLATHSVYGAEATVSFEDREIVERSPAGEVAVWGTVTTWEPPELLSFSWHPGASPDRASQVTVMFAAVGSQTKVTLLHEGWEVYADPTAARDEYDHGWPGVLELYAAHAAGAAA